MVMFSCSKVVLVMMLKSFSNFAMEEGGHGMMMMFGSVKAVQVVRVVMVSCSKAILVMVLESISCASSGGGGGQLYQGCLGDDAEVHQ